MNDSGDRFALARSRLSSRHGAVRREMITAHRLRARRTDSILLAPWLFMRPSGWPFQKPLGHGVPRAPFIQWTTAQIEAGVT